MHIKDTSIDSNHFISVHRELFIIFLSVHSNSDFILDRICLSTDLKKTSIIDNKSSLKIDILIIEDQ